jgi:hypothetical protein
MLEQVFFSFLFFELSDYEASGGAESDEIGSGVATGNETSILLYSVTTREENDRLRA